MIFGISVVLSLFAFAQASIGDSSGNFKTCLYNCKIKECSNQSNFETKQPFYLRFIGWNCIEECKYQCMWSTIKVFQENGINVPKFYGKWPFIRVFGAQELISSLASLLNMFPHIIKLRELRQNVGKKYPIFYSWQGVSVIFCQININAWFWSFLFHIKDTEFTEKLDYFSALLLILFSAYMCSVRLSLGVIYVPIVVGLALFIFFVCHIYYMLSVRFDYGYNMKVTVAVGVITLSTWMMWYMKVRRKQPYAIKVLIISVCTVLLLSLEILDFPPILWLFDAHSLWHLSTPPLAFLWYRFIIEDLHHLKEIEQEEHIA